MKVFWKRSIGLGPLLREGLSAVLLTTVLWMAQSCRPAESPDQRLPFRRSFTVMGTRLEVTVYRPRADARLAGADLDSVYGTVSGIDRRMSLFRADSELARLNSQAGRGPIRISSEILQLLQSSRHYAQLSEGAFDVTVQPLVRLWGFYRMEKESVPPAEKIQAALSRVGPDRFHLEGPSGTVTLASGSRLDLGGVAKGYAVDQSLSVLRHRGVPAALIDLGGNIGVLGQPPGGRSWRVGLQHPRRKGLMGVLHLREGAVATSGDYDRFFEAEGRRFSHLLDPRTGWPAQGLYAVTVVAPTAMAADALSTAAFVLGPERGLALLSDCRGVEGVMMQPPAQPNGDSDEVILRTTPGLVPDGGGTFRLNSGTDAGPESAGGRVHGSPAGGCLPGSGNGREAVEPGVEASG